MIQGVFDVAASPHIVINQRELIVQYNKAAEDAFGYSKEEMVTQSI
jgi:PAS domain S-box-containing protein